MKKYIISFFVITALILAWLFYSWAFVNANPDYICVKDITNQPCKILSCGPWKSWKSICKWSKTIQVAYYHVRTNCEPWYTRTTNLWNSYTENSTNKLKVDRKYITSDTTSSWRHSVDYPNKTISCTIVKTDIEAPEWEIQTDIIK